MSAMFPLRCTMRGRAASKMVSRKLNNYRTAGTFFWKRCWKLEPEIFIVKL